MQGALFYSWLKLRNSNQNYSSCFGGAQGLFEKLRIHPMPEMVHNQNNIVPKHIQVDVSTKIQKKIHDYRLKKGDPWKPAKNQQKK